MNLFYKRLKMTGILGSLSLMLCVGLAWGGVSGKLSRTPAAIGEDGHTLRIFLGEVLKISGHPPGAQAGEMRALFVKYPRLTAWAADANDLDRVLDESGMRAALGAGLEAGHLQKTISQKLSKHLDAMMTSLAGNYAAQARILFPQGAADHLNQGVINSALFTFSQLPAADRARLFDKVDDSEFTSLADSFRSSAENLQVNKLEVLKQMSSANFVKGGGENQSKANQTIRDLFSDYFQSMPIESKLSLLADFLSLAPNASPAEQLKTVLFHTDPFLQKLLQLLGRDMENPVLEEAFAALQNDIKPIPFEDFKTIVEDRLGGRPIETVFRDIDPKLRQASTGVVGFATLIATGERVAIKVQVPGAKKKFMDAARRIADFESVRRNPGMGEMINKAAEGILVEFDYDHERRFTDKGVEIYNRPDLGIAVPKVVESLPQTKDFIVYTFASGKKITDLTEEAALRKRARLFGNFVKVWIDTALFGVGETMFHGDMHPGNLKIDEHLGPKGTIFLMDFGNVGHFTLEERRGFVSIFIACLVGDSKKVVSAMEHVTHEPLAPNDRLARIIDEQFAATKEPAARVESILARAMDEADVKVPTSFVSFIRGARFLAAEIDSINGQLKKIDPSFVKYQRLDFAVLAKESIVSRLSNDLPNQVISRLVREESTVTLRMMTDFFRAYTGQVLRRWFSCDALLHREQGPLKLTE